MFVSGRVRFKWILSGLDFNMDKALKKVETAYADIHAKYVALKEKYVAMQTERSELLREVKSLRAKAERGPVGAPTRGRKAAQTAAAGGASAAVAEVQSPH